MSLDLSKGFSNGAFSSLKALKDSQKQEAEARAQAQLKKDAEERARKEALKREEAQYKRDLRFTDDDINDTSNLSDAEIFAASMMELEGVDIYQAKFNVKDAPKKAEVQEEKPLTLSEDEREFAIFTQEMAISNVKRMTAPPKPVHKTRNKGKYLQNTAAAIEAISPVNVSPDTPEPGMRTDFVAPAVAVTQIEKGEDILERPDLNEGMTKAQKQLLHDVKRHEARYGIVITLKLRGLTLNAAISRLDEFITACVRDRQPYALIVCGKGLGSEGDPVIKNYTLDIVRNDSRIIEYAPVFNADGDFGSLYVSFRRS